MSPDKNEYFQFKQGLIDDDTWAASENIIGIALSSNWSRNWWGEFGPIAFTEPFVTMVNNVLGSADVDYAEIMKKIDK